MNTQSNLASVNETAPRARISIVRTHQLFESKEVPTRGLAHMGFSDVPPNAPGRLDFEPLFLCALGTLYPGEGAKMHDHHDVDNLLLLRHGSLQHRDSLGNEAVVQSGGAYLLSAGESVAHAETVHGSESVHAVVLFLRPDQVGGASRFHIFDERRGIRRGGWSVLASGRPHAAGRALPLRSNSEVLTATLAAESVLEHVIEPGRRAYLAVLDGTVCIDKNRLDTGDRALIEGSSTLKFSSEVGAELLLVDLVAEEP